MINSTGTENKKNAARANDFDIDVDLSKLLGRPQQHLLDSRWYELAQLQPYRDPKLHRKIQKLFQNEMWHLQWQTALNRSPDRRRGLRASLKNSIFMGQGDVLVATEISCFGLQGSGRPKHDRMDIQFRLPNVKPWLKARAEVVSYHESKLLPYVGLSFMDIDEWVREDIRRYVDDAHDKFVLNYLPG